MTIGERIERLIADQQIKKVDFASELSIDQSYVTKLIKGASQPSKRLIDAICLKFRVRREWLVSGEGEMYVKRDDITAIINELSDKIYLDDTTREFLSLFLQLEPENRRLILDGMEQAARLFPRIKSDDELTPDEKAEIVRQESLEEAEAKKTAAATSSASTGTSGTSKKFSIGP